MKNMLPLLFFFFPFIQEVFQRQHESDSELRSLGLEPRWGAVYSMNKMHLFHLELVKTLIGKLLTMLNQETNKN